MKMFVWSHNKFIALLVCVALAGGGELHYHVL